MMYFLLYIGGCSLGQSHDEVIVFEHSTSTSMDNCDTEGNSLMQGIHQVELHNIGPVDTEEEKAVASRFAIYGVGGTIYKSQIGEVLRSLGLNPSDKDVETQLTTYTQENITSTEFLAIFQKTKKECHEGGDASWVDIRGVLNLGDEYHSGRFPKSWLSNKMTEFGLESSVEELEVLMSSLENQRGDVNYQSGALKKAIVGTNTCENKAGIAAWSTMVWVQDFTQANWFTIQDFKSRYGLLVPATNGLDSRGRLIEAEVMCKQIAKGLQLDESEYKIERGNISFTNELRQDLDEVRAKHIHKVLVQLHAWVRGMSARYRYKRLESEIPALSVIQSNVRKYFIIKAWSWGKLIRKAGVSFSGLMVSNSFAPFDQAQLQELKAAFNKIDSNKDGFIDKKDLKNAYVLFQMKKNGMYPSDKDLDDMMKAAPGPINFTMFRTIIGEKMSYDPEDLIKNAFGVFDQGASGFVSVTKLRTILGDRFTDGEFAEMILDAPVHPDGGFNYVKFVRIMKHGIMKRGVDLVRS